MKECKKVTIFHWNRISSIIKVLPNSAKDFFENQLTREFLMSLFPKESDNDEIL